MDSMQYSNHKRLGLRKNFCWTFVGSIIASGCQWAMLMVMTKVLTDKEVGSYILALSITAPVVIMSMLQLRVVHVTDIQNKYGFGDYLGARLATNVMAIIVIAGILVTISGRYDFWVYGLIFIVGVNKVIEATSEIANGVMQKHDRLDKAAQSQIIRNAGALILLAVILKFTNNLIYGVSAVGIWWLLVLVFFDKHNVKYFEAFVPRFHLKSLFVLFWLGLPLGIVGGIIALNANIPRYFVEAKLGTENLAYFGAMSYVVIGASRASLALGRSTTATLARYYFTNRKAYVKLLFKIVMLASLLAAATVLFAAFFGRPFLTLIYSAEYAQRQDVFIWLMTAAGLSMIVSMLNCGMTTTRRFKSQIPVFSITCGVCLLSSKLLVPLYGMKGAAWAILLTMITQGLGGLSVIILALRTPLTETQNTSD